MIGLEIVCYLKEVEYKTLANEMGITPQSINAWLKGTRKIPKDRLRQVSKCLEIDEGLIQKDLTEYNRIDAILAVASILKNT